MKKISENSNKFCLQAHEKIPTNYLDASPWFGYRPMTPDGVGIIGRTEVAGLYLNTGHGHLGWTMSSGTARITADLIGGKKPEIPFEKMGVR